MERAEQRRDVKGGDGERAAEEFHRPAQTSHDGGEGAQ
jgi:hypothetical protein